ncbi:uncharacterized protein UTRI_03028_B [Ustilago trichophora]|uniref:BTB domain-containing protein n=1 Tax=Ustilago trichophora TaxID=86804 RepID=A0A5C3E645_9BASI|nr:uncharacterized protein UTRI_03028_B [Ustilago trichophora]
MPMTEAELTSSLHRVGRIYWHRPDTADCLVAVTRLSQRQRSPQQHQHHRHQNPCICNATDRIVESKLSKRQLRQSASTAPSTPLLQTFSPTISASTLPAICSSPNRLGQMPPASTSTPTQPSSLARCRESDKDFGTKPSNLDGDGVDGTCGSVLQSTQKSSYRSTIGQVPRHRSRASISTLSTLGEDPSPAASEPRRTDAETTASSSISRLLSSGDIRRESAPPNMYAAGTCTRCHSHADDEQDQRVTTYRLHRDFLISQSQVFKQLLQPGRGDAASPEGTAVKGDPSISDDTNHPTTSIEIALPDPSSFAVLIEFFYMGNFNKLTAAMESGKVRWENVMLNASHLGLSAGLKMQLGRWWRERQDRLHASDSVRQAYYRSSMPAEGYVWTSGVDGSGEIGVRYGASTSRSGSGGRRCRAYTTGSRQQVERSECKVSMMPSRALALPTGLVRSVSEEGIPSGSKRFRTTEPDTEASYRHNRHCNTGLQHTNTARSVVQSPRSSTVPNHLPRTRQSMDACWPRKAHDASVEEQLQKDEGRLDDRRAVTRQERPSTVRQLLLGGGKRRRALSNLAYYCSAGTQGSSISAPVKQ